MNNFKTNMEKLEGKIKIKNNITPEEFLTT